MRYLIVSNRRVGTPIEQDSLEVPTHLLPVLSLIDLTNMHYLYHQIFRISEREYMAYVEYTLLHQSVYSFNKLPAAF